MPLDCSGEYWHPNLDGIKSKLAKDGQAPLPQELRMAVRTAYDLIYELRDEICKLKKNTATTAAETIPGAINFNTVRESYSVMTCRDVTVVTPDDIRQIDFLGPSVYEGDCGWFAQGSLDNHSDPATSPMTLIGTSRLG